MMKLPPDDASWVAGILAVAGPVLGGVVLNERAADSFVEAFSASTGASKPFKILPASISQDVFTGSLDLAATLALGRPVRSPALQDSHVMIRRAEALDAACVSHLAAMIDDARVLLVAVTDDDGLTMRLLDRLAFSVSEEVEPVWSADAIRNALLLFAKILTPKDVLQEACGLAVAFGVSSPRSVMHTLCAARAIAALRGMNSIDQDALTLAARLALAHRATRLPAPEEPEAEAPSEPQTQSNTPDSDTQRGEPSETDVVLDAVRAAIPAQLLQDLANGMGKRGSGRNVKSKGPSKTKSTRGRRMGSKRASHLAGQRLDIIGTLRNAAPWQVLRRRLATTQNMIVTRDDFQIHRIKQRNTSTAIFAVDASGSTAFQRLAEAKGAVEAILAECYVRRDKVALVSFRSKTAEELLPPTRSLDRARRALTALPGGGGTPLAAGLDKVFQIVDQVRRAGTTPIVIILTDGRANVTRSGEGNKTEAMQEAETAAHVFAVEGVQSMVIDVSPEPQRHARALAEQMGGRYFAMPRAQACDIARPVTAALRHNA
jgi:magnesium chelatase subunit D